MEVRPGYKQTEVGVIPKDWLNSSIGELRPYVTSGSRGWAAFYTDFGASFIRITNLTRSSIYLNTHDLKFVTLPHQTSEERRTHLQDGDLLISITADIGIVGIFTKDIPSPSYINQHIALVRFDSSNVDPKFVTYFLSSEGPQSLFRALTDGGAKAGMNLSTIKKIQLALPPTIREQKAITEVLSDADALIKSLEQLIAKKRQIKQGTLQDLLTCNRKLPGFEKPWKTKTLGDLLLAHPDYGINAPATVPKNGLPTYLRITDIDEYGTFNKEGRMAVDHPHAHGYFLRPGELVFARTGASVGKTYLYKPSDGEIVFAGFLIRIKIDTSKLNPIFFYNYTTTKPYWNWVQMMSMRSGQPGINSSEFESLELKIPSCIKEQEAIALILNEIDQEISTLQTKLSKARQIKQGMMQQLLTGKIRLITPKDSS